jgi:SPP1 family predicted phage head-tail adaptor
MVRELTHPRMMTGLRNFYPDTCTIQQATANRDGHGQPIDSWDNIAGLVDLPCRVSPLSGREVEKATQEFSSQVVTISLKGAHVISTVNRVLTNGVTYNIRQVDHDGQGVNTRLIGEVVR